MPTSRTHIGTIADNVYDIERLGGLTVVLGNPDELPLVPLMPGSDLEIERPDGGVISCKVSSVEMATGGPENHNISIVLPDDIVRADLPVGSRLYFCDFDN